jgi:putative membrane protein
MASLPLSSIPAINATLNSICFAFLISGYSFIRRGKVALHRACMVTALCCSLAFLTLYVYFHAHAGIIRFGGQGWIRPVYFTILITHTFLAIVNLPLVVITLSFALRLKFPTHRRWARWTLPIWLYVSFTGILVYWLLYIAYTPLGAF